jgi:hypothetical protein
VVISGIVPIVQREWESSGANDRLTVNFNRSRYFRLSAAPVKMCWAICSILAGGNCGNF